MTSPKVIVIRSGFSGISTATCLVKNQFDIVFHDIIVLGWIKIRFRAKSTYMKRIMNAHYIHHKKYSREDCEAFGFLYAPKKYQPS